MTDDNVDEIIRLIILEAGNRKGQDLFGGIATVNMDVMTRMMEILAVLREEDCGNNKEGA